MDDPKLYRPGDGLMSAIVAFLLENKLVAVMLTLAIIAGGIYTSPFDWKLPEALRSPVAVDAIPNLGENQQIVYTDWEGRSPKDVEDQITYPLSSRLLSISGVKTVRSQSMFGFSIIYIIFDDSVPFYFSRDRVQEKLNFIPSNELPAGVKPRLGPDATPLGQVFWYTLEGRDPQGRPVGGWDLHELRSVQDWLVKYEISAVPGVAEVASIGGFVKEYQVEADPDKLRLYNLTLTQLMEAVRDTNLDSGARTMEINRVDYLIRGLGKIQKIADIEEAILTVSNNVPIRVKDVARVSFGPALRTGILDKDGIEAVGGSVVAQFSANPMEVIQQVKKRIEQIAPGLPQKMVRVTGDDGKPQEVLSRVTIVPFYDRSGLIDETLGTLEEALSQEILVTVIVIVVLLLHWRCSLLISLCLPLAVLLSFVAMRVTGVTANILSLGGIAIAIGTIVDMGIVLTENILGRIQNPPPGETRLQSVYHATSEVASAITTAILTTVVGFLPVIFLAGEQGRLYRPLAFTKTFALSASLIVALVAIPVLAYYLLRKDSDDPQAARRASRRRVLLSVAAGLAALWLLALDWLPLGAGAGQWRNILFCGIILGALLLAIQLFKWSYRTFLAWCLRHKLLFSLAPLGLMVGGLLVWKDIGTELMPRLDEGSFLYMPSAMPHASLGEIGSMLSTQGRALAAVPEIEAAVGKAGRADTPLDPAPLNMFETVINYHGEYLRDKSGRLPDYRFDPQAVGPVLDASGKELLAPDGKPYVARGIYPRDKAGLLIPDAGGRPFRLWRPALDPALNPGREAWGGIRSPDDIWDEVVRVTRLPGVTSASELGPIETRIVMLQSGMRGESGVRLSARGSVTLEELQRAGEAVSAALRQVPAINPESVSTDRIVGKPYFELVIDRAAIARHGLTVAQVQSVIQSAVGGMVMDRTIEGRERYNILVRYLRELRDSPEELLKVLVATPYGAQVPLKDLLVDRELKFVRGPEVIKSENGALVMYITFDNSRGYSSIEAVELAGKTLEHLRENGALKLPAGVKLDFAGAYQKYQQTMNYLLALVPAALVIIFMILYFQFHRVSTTLIVFSGVWIAWMSGFVMLWLYGQEWFLNFDLLGASLRELFQGHEIRLSTAVWVGFLALFGVATDDGVIMATYLKQRFDTDKPATIEAVRAATMQGALRRVRPCLMTAATTIIALLPVLTSQGRGAEIMLPMAVPIFGGVTLELISMFVVPVVWCWLRERECRKAASASVNVDADGPGSSGGC